MESTKDGKPSVGPVSHEMFIQLYNKWQYFLGDALIGCLKSTEYIHIRSGLVVLSRLVETFPTGPSIGNKLLKVLEPLQDEKSARHDIRASANAYGMMLSKARDDGKWVEEDEADAKERAEKDKEAAEERKKKIEKSFRELERDNEKITAQIGTDDRDRRDRQRGGLRDQQYQDRRTDVGRQPVGGRDLSDGNRINGDFSRIESGEVSGRDRRGGRDVDWNSRGRDDDRLNSRDVLVRDDSRWRRDGPRNSTKKSRPSSPVDDRESGDDDRRRRDGSTTRITNKRSRPSSPTDNRDSERLNLKRPRMEEYKYSSRRLDRGKSRSKSPDAASSRRLIRRGRR